MYNPRFTTETFDGHLRIRRGCHMFADHDEALFGTISRRYIRDLNGVRIATYQGWEQVEDVNGKKKKVHKYDSAYGMFRVDDREVYLGDERFHVGKVIKRRAIWIFLFLILSLLSLFCLVSLLRLFDLPTSGLPVVVIEDVNGPWDKQATLAVLDSNRIYPGKSGEYAFKVENPHDTNAIYDLSIKDLYNGETVDNFPMEFRLRRDKEYVNDAQWHSIEEMSFTDIGFAPDTAHHYTLEWRWSFVGDDELDTYFGKSGGEYSLMIKITAQTQEG